MNSCLILGTGRSGTSMVAGCFRNTGAFFGDNLLPASPANPLGYYESETINVLNNRLIFRNLYPKGVYHLRYLLYRAPYHDWRAFWLLAPPWIRVVTPTNEQASLIKHLVDRRPFCFKDPRFSVTLPTWLRFLPGDTRLIVVFRDPRRTIDSMLRDASESNSPPLPVDGKWLAKSWAKTYRRLLRWSKINPLFHFVDSDALIRGEGREALNSVSDTRLDYSEIDASLRRSRVVSIGNGSVFAECERVYSALKIVAAQHMHPIAEIDTAAVFGKSS